MRIALVFSLILAVLTVVFALQNDEPMVVDFLFFNTTGSTALVLIVTFTLGVVVGLLSTLPGRIRDKRQLKKFKKDNSPSSGPTFTTGPEASSTPPPRKSSGTSSPSGSSGSSGSGSSGSGSSGSGSGRSAS